MFGIVFNSIIMVAYLVLASIIAYQLYRTVKISRDERIAASRMVYYLIVGSILLVRIPFSLPSFPRAYQKTGSCPPVLGDSLCAAFRCGESTGGGHHCLEYLWVYTRSGSSDITNQFRHYGDQA